jgi:hypothetical protein
MARSAYNRFLILAAMALAGCVGVAEPESDETDEIDAEEVEAADVTEPALVTKSQAPQLAPTIEPALDLFNIELNNQDEKGKHLPGDSFRESDPQPNPWEPPSHNES